jgi:hypothetical protein
MKLTQKAMVLFGAASLVAAVSLPASAFVAGDEVQPIAADVVPTSQETQAEISHVGQRLHEAEFASVSNPDAERDFMAAQRDYQRGWYDGALREAENADKSISAAPNWLLR